MLILRLVLAPVILAVVASIAGHPVNVACDVDTNPSPYPTAPGYVSVAWTLTNGNVIHATPSICDESSSQLGSARFANAIDVFIHEAARARGIVTDDCVEMTATLGVYQVLRDFYAVPFFSRMSRTVGDQVLAIGHANGYRPELCWRGGVYR